jgi:hypothetical protein
MTTNGQTAGVDARLKLTLLWVFVLLNMAYADILSLMDPTSAIRLRMTGTPITPGLLLVGAILMETVIVMVVLCWVLPYKANRWVNIVVAALNILAVVTGGHGLYYTFFATIEVVCMLLIVWFAWTWKPATEPSTGSR